MNYERKIELLSLAFMLIFLAAIIYDLISNSGKELGPLALVATVISFIYGHYNKKRRETEQQSQNSKNKNPNQDTQ